MISPEKYSRWTLPTQTTSHQSLRLDREATLGSLADDEVLVELYAASLNYRDLVVAKNASPDKAKDNVVPGSDGAGLVKAIGKNVTKFKVGDRVVTHMTPSTGDEEFPVMTDVSGGLGHGTDGTLQEFGRFLEGALVKAPTNLDFRRAATLTCSGLTAWNALFGCRGREIRAGDWVLIEGTGGVSIAALQFAAAAQANVVVTTSDDEKFKPLKLLGAKDVINYREVSDWGVQARKLTPGGRGFDLVMDIGGNTTLPQSFKAIRTDGIVAATGILGGLETEPVPVLAAVFHVCIVRGILLGTRKQFADMVEFVERHGISPVVDEAVFNLKDAVEAYDRLEAQRHFSKIVIRIKAEK